jgi:hypothetical protein
MGGNNPQLKTNIMKTLQEIENEIVSLYYQLDKLKEDETHGWSNNIQDIEKTQTKIKALEWVLN